MPLVLQLTNAGLAAVQAAAGSDPTVIAELGLTGTPFTYAPTLEALPGEFKRLPVTSGVAAAPNIAHLTVYDTTADIWTATGFGLFLDDGTLFATYTQEDPVITKASLAFALLAFDIAFNGDIAASISFGDATFTYPPATEEMRGVAEISTQAEVDAGLDDSGFVTPLKLAARIAPIEAAAGAEATARSDADATLADSIAAILARLDGGEFADASSATFADKGHFDLPVGNQVFRINWGKTDVPSKTATTDTYHADFSVCFGVFQGGGTNDVNSSETIRAYPGTGAQSNTHVNLTNGTSGLLTIHWLGIGLAA